ncbi:MAG: hypothetical protein OEZ01_15160 [Candidatus Heimdallarchaeota archaeon]|nr:hypothetical protein [Candidatus Heimdallarchaeota archaeon]
MSKEIIDIIDTAVKIGFGALITAVATYAVTRLNHKKENEKAIINRKLDIIEMAAAHFDKYENSFRRLLSRIDAAVIQLPNMTNFEASNKNHDYFFDLIRKEDEYFCEARDHRSYAMSKLHILDLSNISDLLEELNKLDIEVRDFVLFDKKIPTSAQMEKWRSTLRGVKKTFFTEIGKFYNRQKI